MEKSGVNFSNVWKKWAAVFPIIGNLVLGAGPAAAEVKFYSGTGIVVHTVQCGTTIHSVTGAARVTLTVTNAALSTGFWGTIHNPYLFRFPRNPSVDPIIAVLQNIGFERLHTCRWGGPELYMKNADALVHPPIGQQTNTLGGGWIDEPETTPFDWLEMRVKTRCTGNTCTGLTCSVYTRVRWEFSNIPLVNISTSGVFAGRVVDTDGHAITSVWFFMDYAPGFLRRDVAGEDEDYWENRRVLRTDAEGRFSTRVMGEGPIRVMSYQDREYNGFTRLFHVPETNAVIHMIPKSLMDYDCVLQTKGLVQARERVGGVWGAWFTVHPGTRLNKPWHIATEDGAECLVHSVNDSSGNPLTDARIRIGDGREYGGPSAVRAGFFEDLVGNTIQCLGGMVQAVIFPPKPLSETNRLYLSSPRAFTSVHGTGLKVAATGGVDIIEVANGVVSVTPTNRSPAWRVTPEQRLATDGRQVWMESMAADEWAALESELETIGWDVEPALRADFADGALPPWLNQTYGCWGASPSNTLRFAGFQADDFPFALINYPCADASIQADARKLSGDSPGFGYGHGLHLRSDGVENNYYEFAITKSGQYMIRKYVNGGWTTLVNWRQTNALNTGFGVWNTLKATARGTNLSLYANGRLLATLHDKSLSNGYFGVFAIDAAASTNSDLVEFDNVSLIVDTPSRPAHPPYIFHWSGPPLGGASRLSWSGEPAEWYTVRGCSNLLAGFDVITENIRGEYPVTTYSNSVPAGPAAMFYRVDRQ